MINIIKYNELGVADHGWLNAHYHFSFSQYYNPKRMGFGNLRVINDDVIKAGTGFATHSHTDMEIITYVRQGAITHKDSFGNQGKTIAGDVQVMSAGSGISHSEYNLESEDTNLYQIWIEPNEYGVTPKWAAKEFPSEYVSDSLNLLVAGDGTAPLHIHQDAYIYGGKFTAGTSLTHTLMRDKQYNGYVLISKGEMIINDHHVSIGDGMEITEESVIELSTTTESELVLIEVR